MKTLFCQMTVSAQKSLRRDDMLLSWLGEHRNAASFSYADRAIEEATDRVPASPAKPNR